MPEGSGSHSKLLTKFQDFFRVSEQKFQDSSLNFLSLLVTFRSSFLKVHHSRDKFAKLDQKARKKSATKRGQENKFT